MATFLKSAILGVFCMGACMAGELLKLDKLTLKSGREYENVTVLEKADDGIKLSHASGIARVKFEDLPAEIVEQLGGFDPKKAEQARKNKAIVDAAVAKSQEAQESRAAQAALIESTREKLTQSAKKYFVKVIQAHENGALCRISITGDEWSEQNYFVEGASGMADNQTYQMTLVDTGKLLTYTSILGARKTVGKLEVLEYALKSLGK